MYINMNEREKEKNPGESSWVVLSLSSPSHHEQTSASQLFKRDKLKPLRRMEAHFHSLK
jgi:hypothetical protein